MCVDWGLIGFWPAALSMLSVTQGCRWKNFFFFINERRIGGREVIVAESKMIGFLLVEAFMKWERNFKGLLNCKLMCCDLCGFDSGRKDDCRDSGSTMGMWFLLLHRTSSLGRVWILFNKICWKGIK